MPKRATRSRTENGTPLKRGGIRRFTDDFEAAVLEFMGTVLFLLIALGGAQAVTMMIADGGGPVSYVERNMYVFFSPFWLDDG
jgi:hypothetical protein